MRATSMSLGSTVTVLSKRVTLFEECTGSLLCILSGGDPEPVALGEHFRRELG
jgi:hypothetical protein